MQNALKKLWAFFTFLSNDSYTRHPAPKILPWSEDSGVLRCTNGWAALIWKPETWKKEKLRSKSELDGLPSMKVKWLGEGHRKGYKAGTLWDYSRHLSSLSESSIGCQFCLHLLVTDDGDSKHQHWRWSLTHLLPLSTFLPSTVSPSLYKAVSPWWHNSSFAADDQMDKDLKERSKVKHDFEVLESDQCSMLTLTEMVDSMQSRFGGCGKVKTLVWNILNWCW